MVPLADVHVHLLAGLDDGPRTDEEALDMCRMLVSEGAKKATALAHQNSHYPENNADKLRSAAQHLIDQAKAQEIALNLYPSAEVILDPELPEQYDKGHLLTISDKKKYLLVEMPHGIFIDPRPIAAQFQTRNIRLVIAHAERYPEMLHDPILTKEIIVANCLIQVSTEAIAEPAPGDEAPLRLWAKSGMIHLLGSDGHRMDRRQPRLQNGFRRLIRWIGAPSAERIGGIWGSAVLQGLDVKPPVPRMPQKTWFTRLFGL